MIPFSPTLTRTDSWAAPLAYLLSESYKHPVQIPFLFLWEGRGELSHFHHCAQGQGHCAGLPTVSTVSLYHFLYKSQCWVSLYCLPSLILSFKR